MSASTNSMRASGWKRAFIVARRLTPGPTNVLPRLERDLAVANLLDAPEDLDPPRLVVLCLFRVPEAIGERIQ
jgi:hypothetical protein